MSASINACNAGWGAQVNKAIFAGLVLATLGTISSGSASASWGHHGGHHHHAHYGGFYPGLGVGLGLGYGLGYGGWGGLWWLGLRRLRGLWRLGLWLGSALLFSLLRLPSGGHRAGNPARVYSAAATATAATPGSPTRAAAAGELLVLLPQARGLLSLRKKMPGRLAAS